MSSKLATFRTKNIAAYEQKWASFASKTKVSRDYVADLPHIAKFSQSA